MGFEILEHTSEVGFEARGETLEEAFESAGRAVFELMTDTGSLKRDEEIDISVESESLESLFYDFIDEMVYISQAERILLKDFDVEVDEEACSLSGKGFGQRIEEGMRLQEVKAPTYSDMAVERDGGWRLRMFVDV